MYSALYGVNYNGLVFPAQPLSRSQVLLSLLFHVYFLLLGICFRIVLLVLLPVDAGDSYLDFDHAPYVLCFL